MLTNLHWINDAPKSGQRLHVRTRHRAPLEECTLVIDDDSATVALVDQLRALTPGQSAVLYDGERVVGGGIII